MKIQCQTLFDITATGITGHIKPGRMPFTDRAGTKIADAEQWHRSRNQQRNWETITQLISLRTQVNDLSDPVKIQDQWQFEFEVENENLFADKIDPLAVLKIDCDSVPMLTGLGESATAGTVLAVDQNIWFAIIPINNS
jgi:hypothetical protein